MPYSLRNSLRFLLPPGKKSSPENGLLLPKWEVPPDTVLAAHISDIHFGSPNQGAVWDETKTLLLHYRPKLLLVTGDIAHSPDRATYVLARTELEKLANALKADFFVCPGNHDRHPLGNVAHRFMRLIGRADTHAQFTEQFQNHLVSSEKATVYDGIPGWRIGLFGIDSSINADYFARGFVDKHTMTVLERYIEKEKASSGWDLTILLIHHHLQAVRALELEAEGKDLFNVVALANSGTLLECLTRCNIDLALHGHQHATHWSRYGSLENSKSELSVLGAGSATGNHSTKGCSRAHASFNFLLFHPDRSVGLRVVKGGEIEWSVGEEVKIYGAATGRKLRLVRAATAPIEGDLDTSVTKYVAFTPERDIEIRWVFTNWRFKPGKDWEYDIENSTGVPEKREVTARDRQGVTHVLDCEIKVSESGSDHEYTIMAKVPSHLHGIPVQLDFAYRWRAGAILNSDDVDIITQGGLERRMPGLLRNQGYEYSSIRSFGAVAVARLILEIPADLAPDDLELRVYDAEGKAHSREAKDLQSMLVKLGAGRFGLVVPYPRLGWLYAVAWKPKNQNTSEFQANIAKRTDELRNVITKARPAIKKQITGKVTLAVYCREGESTIAKSVVSLVDEDLAPPPMQVSARGDTSIIGNALWGNAVAALRPLNDENLAQVMGFTPNESAIVAVPLRYNLNPSNLTVLGVLRVGLSEQEDIRKLYANNGLHSCLHLTALELLTVAFSPP